LSTIYSRPLIYQFKKILFTIIILSTIRRNVLENYRSDGMDDLGAIQWSLALYVFAGFYLVYFSLWKGVRSTGKVITFFLTSSLSLSHSPHPGLKCFDGYKSSCIIATSLGGSICIHDTPYLSIRVFDQWPRCSNWSCRMLCSKVAALQFVIHLTRRRRHTSGQWLNQPSTMHHPTAA
jgi:hypothetical protein